MQGHLRLGRVAGIELRADWSALLVALVFFISLSAHFFTHHVDWSLGLSVITALFGTAATLIVMWVPEVVKTIVARRARSPVTAITLFLLGGIATYRRETRAPEREILISSLGPATSVVIGIVLFALAGLFSVPLGKLWADPSGVLGWLSPVPAVLAWTAIASFGIALFNAMPAFPLDGGRIVRAILWELDGDYRVATRLSARIGQAIALVLVAVGVASAFRLGPLHVAGGVWLTFLGWFLLTAASAYHHSAIIEERLGGLMASHLMRPVTVAIGPDLSIADAVGAHFVGTWARALPVMESERCVGVLRFDDVRRVPAREWPERPVRDAMVAVKDLPVIRPYTDLAQSLHAMTRAEITTLPILDGDDVVGVLEMHDVVRWMELPEPEPAIAPV